jgi:uncharacterized protein (DUF1697 family)
MPRYVAFLRGVSPLTTKMQDLRSAFELAGFQDVRTLLSSGNVVFSSRAATEVTLVRKAEQAMQTISGRTYATFVRPSSQLVQLIESDPCAEFEFNGDAQPVITFLRAPPPLAIDVCIGSGDTRVLKLFGTEVLSTCVPGPKGSAFMKLLERSFGSDTTTRTLGTVKKCSWA